eukprot:jgi/Mesvir1/21326/Mv06694-RA.1
MLARTTQDVDIMEGLGWGSFPTLDEIDPDCAGAASGGESTPDSPADTALVAAPPRAPEGARVGPWTYLLLADITDASSQVVGRSARSRTPTASPPRRPTKWARGRRIRHRPPATARRARASSRAPPRPATKKRPAAEMTADGSEFPDFSDRVKDWPIRPPDQATPWPRPCSHVARDPTVRRQDDAKAARAGRCTEPGCGVFAWYGLPGNPASRCASHKRRGDVRYPRMRCSECKELGTRDLEGVRYCECHAPADSRNVAIHPCSVCGLDDILDASGRCPTCDPDRAAKIARRHEMQVKAFLDAEIAAGSLPPYETHDRMIDGGACVRVRPDFVWDAGTHVLVLEVDEHQHMHYACECEQTRMVNVGQAMGMPTLFIRYNPDGFRVDDGGARGTGRCRS